MILRIRRWKDVFETPESRKYKKLNWVAIPNKMHGQGYTSLVDHPNGAAHLGAWCAIVEICSARGDRDIRGILPEADGSTRGICRCLGRISRLPIALFEEVLPRLIDDPEIQWIERIGEEPGDSSGEPGDSPGEPVIHNITEHNITEQNTHTACARLAQQKDTPSPLPLPLPLPLPSAAPEVGTGIHVRVARPRWKSDREFVAFTTDYLATGAAFVDNDFHEAFEYCWRTLDFEQKLGRRSALNRHMEEYQSNPRFVSKPLKFLETEWERPIRPAARQIQPERRLTPTEQVIAAAHERIAREKENHETEDGRTPRNP